MRFHPLAPLTVVALLAQGCGSGQTGTVVPALTRPDSVAFACFELCDPDEEEDCVETDDGPPPDRVLDLGGCAPDDEGDFSLNPSMHALVVQSSTGEVGAIQIDGPEFGVRDTDARIPGFTFVPTGEAPSTVVTPRSFPRARCTYVANRGSNNLTVIPTDGFRASLGTDSSLTGESLAGARPTDLVLSPDESSLWVTLPLFGAVAQLDLAEPVGTGPEGEVTVEDCLAAVSPIAIVPLLGETPDPVDLRDVPTDELPPDVQVVCPRDTTLIDPPLVPPRTPVSRGTLPSPWGFAVDEQRGVLFVSDTALPIIHVIDIASETELEPLNVQVPTRQLALTPALPATAGDPSDRSERYLYAVDDLDSTVLVVDVTDPDRGSYGAVLPIDVRQSRALDRIPFPVATRDIEIVTPGYTENASNCVPDEVDQLEDIGPEFLRGVFLAAAGLDGLIRFVDILDLDASCRGDETCAPPGNPEDQLVFIRRHRVRIGTQLLDTLVSVRDGPQWSLSNGFSAQVDLDGTTPDLAGFAPDLLPVECPPDQGRLFPSSGSPILCTVTDPWGAEADFVSIRYEGPIPFTIGSGGLFLDGGQRIQVRFDPCSVGVLGAQNLLEQPEDSPLTAYGGAAVVLTSTASSLDPEVEESCREEFPTVGIDGGTVLTIPLLEARSGSSEGGYLGELVLGDPPGTSLARVAECFGDRLELEVRVEDAFRVLSAEESMLHRVTAGPDGSCRIDPEANPRLRARAFFDDRFESATTTFSLGPAPGSLLDPILSYGIDDEPPFIGFSLGPPNLGTGENVPSLAVTVTYNPVDERLYGVDQASRGLVVIELSPLRISTETVRGRGSNLPKIFR
ncbi:MAG: YncE family protein [Sandaracinaceae bacterium]